MNRNHQLTGARMKEVETQNTQLRDRLGGDGNWVERVWIIICHFILLITPCPKARLDKVKQDLTEKRKEVSALQKELFDMKVSPVSCNFVAVFLSIFSIQQKAVKDTVPMKLQPSSSSSTDATLRAEQAVTEPLNQKFKVIEENKALKMANHALELRNSEYRSEIERLKVRFTILLVSILANHPCIAIADRKDVSFTGTR
jgi:hypothetical protein